MGKGLRDVLRRAGYRVLLVDEFRTSVQCSRCKTEAARCHPFLHREGEAHLVHGLLLCQQCGRRDHNGAIQHRALDAHRAARRSKAGLPQPPRRGSSAAPAQAQATRRR